MYFAEKFFNIYQYYVYKSKIGNEAMQRYENIFSNMKIHVTVISHFVIL